MKSRYEAYKALHFKLELTTSCLLNHVNNLSIAFLKLRDAGLGKE